MKMFLVVYRYYLEDQVRKLLSDMDVRAFSEAPKVLGVGEAGKVADSHTFPGYNSCIFAALPDEEVEHLVEGFRDFSEAYQEEHGKPAPLRAFVMPCDQVV